MTRLFSTDSLEVSDPVLSPDGRWVVFTTYDAQASNLWLVPAAGGGPTRLTSGRHLDMDPAWFPSGDRIAFRSDRPSAPGNPQAFVMVLPFDARTGQAAGPARQVSLEQARSFSVSPDGQSIAYSTRRDTLSTLVLIPATGGTARLLAALQDPAYITRVQWTRDGAFVYFAQRRTGTSSSSILRVPAAGGSPQQVGTAPFDGSQSRISPGGDFLLTRSNQGPSQGPLFHIATIAGRPLARLELPRNMQPISFTPDGRGLVAIQSNMVAPIRVVPVAGGPMRQLTEAREYDWPQGWSSDGSLLYVATRTNGHGAILQLPVAGGPATQWPLPAGAKDPILISPDGRYGTYSLMDSSQSALRTLLLRRFSDGQTRVVTRALHSAMGQPSVSGPGGRFLRNGQEFLYFERRNDRMELWSTPFEGPGRLLRSFPASLVLRSKFGVHGNRIAYVERRGDSTAVFLAEGQSGRPRLLVTVAGSAADPAWSHDGRWLAFDFYPPGEATRFGVMLIGVGANGTVTTAPRVLDAGPQWGWQKQWLPDDRALTVFGMTGVAVETHVYLVSLREGERPVALTRDDPTTRWWYELSPDGRHVAYPAEISRGSSIWRLDLGETLKEIRSPAGVRR
jgi:Tol biopolymer transport system component